MEIIFLYVIVGAGIAIGSYLISGIIVFISRKSYGGGSVSPSRQCSPRHVGPVAVAKTPGAWQRCMCCGKTLTEEEQRAYWRAKATVDEVFATALADTKTK